MVLGLTMRNDKQKRILVVDDEAGVRLVMGDALRRLGAGYEIATVADAQEALERIDEQPFDLVITDLMLPGMSGVQLTEILRSQSPGVPTIWITARGCHRLRQEAERLEVYRCLDKPIGIQEIRRNAREALAERGDP